MKSLLILGFMLFSYCSWASPLMSTREQVRMELWFVGVENDIPKKEQTTNNVRPVRLPIELEQSLLKF